MITNNSEQFRPTSADIDISTTGKVPAPQIGYQQAPSEFEATLTDEKLDRDASVLLPQYPQERQNTADFQESEDFSKQWFKERSRQAKLSFNIAVGLAGTTAALSIVLTLSVALGKLPVTAIAGLGSIFGAGAVSAYCLKLSQHANKQLDATAKELLNKADD